MARTYAQIVISRNAHFDVRCMAKDFSEYLGGVPVVTDDAPELPNEILWGSTNRPESAKVAPEVCVFSCKGEKWVFDAVHYQALRKALTMVKKEGAKECAPDRHQLYRTDVPLTWGEYKLVWNDEFEGDSLDLEKWTGRANMCFDETVLTMENGTVDVCDSVLTLTTTLLDSPSPKAKYLTNYALCTCDTMNYRYGYMEIRAKVPMYGLGEWPSFWYKSQDSYLWKADEKAKGIEKKRDYFVEVDAFEVFSHKYNVISNLHKWYYQPQTRPDGTTTKWECLDGVVPSLDRAYIFTDSERPLDWHTYGFLWTPERMSFCVDGQFYYHYDLKNDFSRVGSGMQDYDQALNVIFNNMLYTESFLKTCPERAAKDELFPLVYQIDYCRLYQLEGQGDLYLPQTPGQAKRIDPNGVDRRDHGIYRSQQE